MRPAGVFFMAQCEPTSSIGRSPCSAFSAERMNSMTSAGYNVAPPTVAGNLLARHTLDVRAHRRARQPALEALSLLLVLLGAAALVGGGAVVQPLLDLAAESAHV